MGLFDALTSLVSTPAYAEEPAQAQPQSEAEENDEVVAKAQGEAKGEEKSDEQEDADGGADGGEGEEDESEGGDDVEEEDDDDEEEEEEEEEEAEDPMPKFKEECAQTAPCAHHKHEYDDCAERVQMWNDAEPKERKRMGPKEDCIEEFFEFTHCVTQCAAPKLFKSLK